MVFSTNLVSNYDRAFESRVRHFHFSLPDVEARSAIWQKLLVSDLPLGPDLDLDHLSAATEGFSGREIKLAVLAAAERAAVAEQDEVTLADFESAIDQIKTAREQLKSESARPATPEEQAMIESDLKARGLIGERTADTADLLPMSGHSRTHGAHAPLGHQRYASTPGDHLRAASPDKWADAPTISGKPGQGTK